MTNEQMNALTKAIITGFNSLARATAWAGLASRSHQTGGWAMFDAKPDCCALPIEPPAPGEAESPGIGYRWLLVGELCQYGDQYHDGDGWENTYRLNAEARARQYRRKIDAKDGGA